ncbi:alpha-glucosidase/alpha-galactosidase [Clostridia bacterium]|nr:alpha-glucosidase/alpha-galactosidase [Clostridia bacterium]
MPKKIAFIGAGSVVFTRNLARDIITFPAFSDCEIALMDIEQENLDLAQAAVKRIVAEGKSAAKVTATLDLAAALDGADGVLTTIQVGDDAAENIDCEIPKEYGISLSVGDTRGPSGIFRFLRTLPPLLDILHAIERYCPKAVYLNYTNPMAMLCRTMQEVSPKTMVSGLCHSVQGTAEMLAKWLGAPMDEITYVCAGINHQAHYLKFDRNGVDQYPELRRILMEKPEIFNEEQVRNEMFLRLGYYVTESSGHNSEYVSWFRKRPELIEQYCTHGTGWNPGLDRVDQRRSGERKPRAERRRVEFDKWINGDIKLERGNEYAAYIFNAIFGDKTLFEFNGNVRNFGLIDNLPEGCCVEVPVLAGPGGLKPIHVGPLPPQLAILNQLNASIEELAVEAALEGDPRKVYHSCLYDPLTSAMLSMKEIEDMVKKFFKAEKEWLPQFKTFDF